MFQSLNEYTANKYKRYNEYMAADDDRICLIVSNMRLEGFDRVEDVEET